MNIGYAVAGERDGELLWMCEPNTFSSRGNVTGFGSIAWPEWLASARIESHSALVLVAAEGREWGALSEQLWAFIPEVLPQVGSWIVQPEAAEASEGGSMCAADARLCAAVDGVLAGEFGQFVTGHGGEINVLGIHDGVVRVALAGACSGCSLADVTVKLRLERDIRMAAGADFAELIAERTS